MTTTVLAYIPSPSQGVWHLGPFPLRAYALFIIVGIVAALVIGDRRWVARGGEPGLIYDVALWAVPFGLIGGRLYHVMTDWPTYFGEGGVGLAAALRIWDGGLGIWGAVALGGVGAWIACRRRGIPLPAFGDAIAPGIVLAQAIGRLGNYFNQELYGRETTLPWGLEIYERRNAAGVLDSLNGVSTGELVQVVHPTFLYELLWNLLVFAFLILVDRRFKIGHGRLFALYVAGYCVGRFWIELMRSDTATLLAGIRVNTFTSTFVFIGAVVYVMVAPKGREAPETLRGNQDAESDVEELAKDVAMASATGVVAAATVAGRDEDVERDAGGIGAVEGDEAVEAAEGASAAHDAAVEGAADAGVLAAQLDVSDDEGADEESPEADGDAVVPPVPAEAGGIGAVEGDEAVEAAEGAATAGQVVSDDADEPDDAAAEVDAEAVAEELAAEAEPMSEGGEPATEVAEVDAEAVTGAEGLGSVEGDEVAEAVAEASEVHEVAVEGESAAEELGAEAEAADSGAESVAVEGVESGVSGEPATEVAEVDAEAVAEELAADAEPTSEDGEPAPEGDEVAEAVAEAQEELEGVESTSEDGEPATEVAEVDAEAVTGAEGLGSVEGDEVAEAVAEAPEVHEVAVEGESVAEELGAEAEAADSGAEADVVEGVESGEAEPMSEGGEPATEVAEVDAEAVSEELAADAEPGEPATEVAEVDAEAVTGAEDLGPVESDELAGPESTEANVDDESESESSVSPVVTESSYSKPESGSEGRVRQWLRRRRNR